MSDAPFESSLQHVLAELERVDLLLRERVRRLRQRKPDDKFEGLYVSEQELDAQLGRPLGVPRWAGEDSPADLARHDLLRRHRRDLVARSEAARTAGVRLRLEELVERFELSLFDRGVLLLALAPEVDRRYERIFAYLQDDVTRRRPGLDLVLDLLCPTLADKLAARARFAATAPLVRHDLVELFDDPAAPRPALLGRYLRLDPRIAGHLLDVDALAPELVGVVDLDPHRLPHRRLGSPASEALRQRIAASFDPRDGLVINLVGARDGSERAWAQALCAELGLGLVAARAPDLLGPGVPGDRRARLVGREAALRGAAVYWDDVDALVEDEHRTVVAALLGEHHGLIFLAGERPWFALDRRGDRPFTRVELPAPTYVERLDEWRRELPPALPAAVASELPAIASQFRFAGDRLRAAAASARERARWRDGAPELTVDDLYAGCRAQSSHRLGELARAIRPHYGWADIVLPADSLGQLRELCDRVRLRGRVHDDWGFDRKLSLGKGVNVLFAGPSGTGKTMAAEIVARELGLDLYKIDLAGVVSKYIGETEKNLARIFAEAERSSAILFFDEADALFGKRSEVKDAHDRYANIETSYLLQRMEAYEGLTILATNLRKNLDEAFVRRMAFVLAFSLPEAAERLDLWRKAWPVEAPLDPALDLEFMARQFKLSGANIKNIAIAAAFLAAAEGAVIAMRHLVTGTRRELQKLGRLCVPADFGPYAAIAE